MNTPTNAAMRPSDEPCNLFAPDDIVRHVRSGHTYRVLGRCTIEATLADCYMYRSTDGHVWIRPVLEMEDGRFVLLTRELDAAQPAQAGEAVLPEGWTITCLDPGAMELRFETPGYCSSYYTVRGAGIIYAFLKALHESTPHPQPEQPASDERLTVAEVATLLGRKGLDVLKALQRHGVMATLNQRIDFKDALLAASWVEQPASAVSPAAYCDASDPHSSTAFSWPGTAREPWHTTPLYLQAQSPAVSPPSVVAVSEIARGLRAAFPLFDDKGLSEEEHHCEWTLQQDRKRLHAALESFASRMGSGERDAVDVSMMAYEAGWLACVEWSGRDDLKADVGSEAYCRDRDAAIAQQNKRGEA